MQHLCLNCSGFSFWGPQALGFTGFSSWVHRLSCSEARGIFPDQGSNPCLLYWQTDSLPLSHQGSPFMQTLLKTLNSSTISILQNRKLRLGIQHSWDSTMQFQVRILSDNSNMFHKLHRTWAILKIILGFTITMKISYQDVKM